MEINENLSRNERLAAIMREGNDRVTAAIILDAREAAAERNASPRYRYEFYRDTAIGETPHQTMYLQRAQWLVFDRNGVGCFASFGTEADAALTVAALNAYQPAESLDEMRRRLPTTPPKETT